MCSYETRYPVLPAVKCVCFSSSSKLLNAKNQTTNGTKHTLFKTVEKNNKNKLVSTNGGLKPYDSTLTRVVCTRFVTSAPFQSTPLCNDRSILFEVCLSIRLSVYLPAHLSVRTSTKVNCVCNLCSVPGKVYLFNMYFPRTLRWYQPWPHCWRYLFLIQYIFR